MASSISKEPSIKEELPSVPATDTGPQWDTGAQDPENPAHQSPRAKMAGAKGAVAARFNSLFPPHRTYFGRSRRTFLLVVCGAILALLALIIGLAAGLTAHKNK